MTLILRNTDHVCRRNPKLIKTVPADGLPLDAVPDGDKLSANTVLYIKLESYFDTRYNYLR